MVSMAVLADGSENGLHGWRSEPESDLDLVSPPAALWGRCSHNLLYFTDKETGAQREDMMDPGPCLQRPAAQCPQLQGSKGPGAQAGNTDLHPQRGRWNVLRSQSGGFALP